MNKYKATAVMDLGLDSDIFGDDGLDLDLFKDDIKMDIDDGLDFKIDDGLEDLKIDDGLEDLKIDMDPLQEIELLKNMDLGLDSDPFKLPDIE